jgi:hypothetical protein
MDSSKQAQRAVIQFLSAEGVSGTDIYSRMKNVYGTECMSRTAVFRWCSDFRHADKNWITARWACLEESMARSLTVISFLLQSTTHCRYRVHTKFLLTYTAIYRRNRKVLPLGITALQPQSHFHLGTPYIWMKLRSLSYLVFLTLSSPLVTIHTVRQWTVWEHKTIIFLETIVSVQNVL